MNSLYESANLKGIVWIAMVFLFLNVPALTHAESEENNFERLLKSSSLKCIFDVGYGANWGKGQPKFKKGGIENPIIFDSITPKEKTARMLGNTGATSVVVFATAAGLTFMEKTGAGNLIITTVFGTTKDGTNEFIAVHSRHIGMFLGRPLPSQYHGTCKVWDF